MSSVALGTENIMAMTKLKSPHDVLVCNGLSIIFQDANLASRFGLKAVGMSTFWI